MRIKVLATVALILGVMLITSVALAASYPDIGVGLGSTETWVMNVHETLDANVVARYVDQDGYQTGSIQSTIDPLGNDSFPASSSDLDSGWLGSMSVDSLRPIASIAENTWQDVPIEPVGDGWSASAFNDTAEGADEIYFPGVCKTSYHRSIVSVQCVDTEDCQVYMTYRDQEGSLITGSPFVDTIQPFSQETYDLWDPSVNPNIPEQQYTPSPWYGSLEVTSTQLIAGVARTHSRPGFAFAYNAVPRTSSTEIFFPGFVRRKWGEWAGQSDWSNISVYNLNDSTITVHVNLYDDEGDSALHFTDTIPAHGSHAYNARYSTEWPFDELPSRFIGSAVVTSTHPIVGCGSIIRAPGDGLAGGHYGYSEGHQKLVFPVAYLVNDEGTWGQWSGIGIQNVDPENQITVYFNWMDSDGDFLHGDYANVPPYASFGYNTRYSQPAYEEYLGDDWTGTVVVTTTSPAGIAGLILNQTVMPSYLYIAQYNGVPIE